MFREAGCDGPSHFEVPRGEVVELSIDDVVAAMFFGQARRRIRFGPRRPDFEPQLRALLATASDDGHVLRASAMSPSTCGVRA